MRRISFVLSTLSAVVAFSVVLLALGETYVSAAGIMDRVCTMTPMPGYLSECACEENAGNGSLVYSCSKSLEYMGMGVVYYCVPMQTKRCSLGVTDCGEKYTCNPHCNSMNRYCIDASEACDSVTKTGCGDF